MNAPERTSVDTPSREQLLYWLHEAAEIEHNLMCCYLYAAFSLKRVDPRWTPAQAAAVERWRRDIQHVALEEMTHLALVANLMHAIGGTAHFNRPAFPVEAGPYPAGFVIRLAPFCVDTVAHFLYLERPPQAELGDAPAFAAPAGYRRQVPEGRLSPGARDYATVGELYSTLAAALEAFAIAHGEAELFSGDPARQVDASIAPLPGLRPVRDLDSALAAIETIVTQGEGAGAESEGSHFCRFGRVHDELRSMLAQDPAFEPAWPAATNPVMNAPLDPVDRVHIDRPGIDRWLDIGNALYTTSLRCLLQGFHATARPEKGAWIASSLALMRALVPVGEGLAARPARREDGPPHAGLTFTPLRTLARLPARNAAAFVAARLGELQARAQALPVVPVAGESPQAWADTIAAIARERARLQALADAPPATSPSAPPPAAAPAAVATVPPPAPAGPGATPADPDPDEIVEGTGLTLHFSGRRCIHARHCVLEAPTVFKANTPGAWIFPDTLALTRLVEVAHKCPSGAIRYVRRDGGPPEDAPPVNTLRVRENGPYAIHAPLQLAGRSDGFRATLCRCGASKRKPWCDGSHAEAGFVASGEPPVTAPDPLAVRDGPLEIEPQRNGPLAVRGNLEILGGTGRLVARITEARLCRCGRSGSKPFCDGSHAAAGFVADGA